MPRVISVSLYNIAVTLWFHLTPDLQFIMPFAKEVDTAIVAGLRGKIES